MFFLPHVLCFHKKAAMQCRGTFNVSQIFTQTSTLNFFLPSSGGFQLFTQEQEGNLKGFFENLNSASWVVFVFCLETVSLARKFSSFRQCSEFTEVTEHLLRSQIKSYYFSLGGMILFFYKVSLKRSVAVRRRIFISFS